MGIDFLSNLPIDISKMIFFDCLNEHREPKCLSINKRINELISSLILSNLNISPDPNLKPYSKLMKHYKEYCNFFCKKLPIFVDLKSCQTVTKTKELIDRELHEEQEGSLYGYSGTHTLLKLIWSQFLDQIDPNPNLIHSNSGEWKKKDDSLILDPNEEVKMFLWAGASDDAKSNWRIPGFQNVFSTIIKQDWCTLDTAQMLFNYKFTIGSATVLEAIKPKKFEKLKIMLPALLKEVMALDWLLDRLCRNVPSSDKSLIKAYLVRVVRV